MEAASAADPHALDEPAALFAWGRALGRVGRVADARGGVPESLLPRASALPPAERGRAEIEAALLAEARGPAGLDEAIALFRQARRDAQDSLQTVAGLALALALDRAGEREESRVAARPRGAIRAPFSPIRAHSTPSPTQARSRSRMLSSRLRSATATREPRATSGRNTSRAPEERAPGPTTRAPSGLTAARAPSPTPAETRDEEAFFAGVRGPGHLLRRARAPTRRRIPGTRRAIPPPPRATLSTDACARSSRTRATGPRERSSCAPASSSSKRTPRRARTCASASTWARRTPRSTTTSARSESSNPPSTRPPTTPRRSPRSSPSRTRTRSSISPTRSSASTSASSRASPTSDRAPRRC